MAVKASFIAFSALSLTLAGGSSGALRASSASMGLQRDQVGPPPTRVDDVIDVLHGVPVKDAYRWLEDQESREMRTWIEKQTVYSRSLLDGVSGRQRVRTMVEAIEKVERVSIPFGSAGGRYLLSKSSDVGAAPAWYVRDSSTGKDRLLLTAPRQDDGAPMGLQFKSLSSDGKLLAYGLRRGGEDQTEVRFVDIDTGRLLSDRLPRELYGDTFALPDRTGFYYARRRASGTRILFHRFGTDVETDREIFGSGFDDTQLIRFNFSPDGRYAAAFVSAGAGTAAPTRVYLMNRERGESFLPFITDVAATFSGFFGGSRLFLRTTWNAPNGRLIAVDPTDPARDLWQDIIPESQNVLLTVEPAAGRLIVLSMENVSSRLDVVEADGRLVRRIELPTLGNVYSLTSFGWEQDEVFYQFSSLANPTTYRYNVATGQQTVWFRPAVPMDSAAIETKQVWYASKDGTRVPMFVISRKGTRLDGDRPTLLSGYGGYGAITSPFYLTEAAVWVQAGGVYAYANIRGGGEFGEAWHRAGMLANKQNTFDDFLAAAEWLIANKYTRPDRLAIIGGSNGGMLVGVAAVQRPDLFRAVVSRYPHLDMIRYHKFLAAAPWVKEYGSPDIAEEFAYLYQYSPYHHVKDGEKYPAMLLVTGDSDTRVAPLHARKMTARMQAATASGRPVLLRYDVRSGHSGSSIGDRIEQLTDELSFLFWQVGAALPE